MLAFWVVALGLLVFAATGKAEQKLVTIDAPSNYIDLSTQNLAGPVSSTMGPHPGKLKAQPKARKVKLTVKKTGHKSFTRKLKVRK